VYHQNPNSGQRFLPKHFLSNYGARLRIDYESIERPWQVYSDNASEALFFSSVPAQMAWTTSTPGHSFDFVWGVFQAMVRTGLLSPKNKLVLLHSTDCLFCTLLGKVLHLTAIPPNSRLPLVVFNKVKTSQMTFPTLRSDLYFPLFKLRSKAIKGLFEPKTSFQDSKKLVRIGIHRKLGGHAFLNHDEIVGYLKLRRNLQVIELGDFDDTTENAELRVINSLDIYMLPSEYEFFDCIH
jgi:hypothetical protein